MRNASRPPLWSTLLIALVETRRRTLRPSASEMKVTLHRFGRKRRLVLMLEWLTLWPTRGPFAVSSQRRDITKILAHPRRIKPVVGRRRGQNSHQPTGIARTYRGERRKGQGLAHPAPASFANRRSRKLFRCLTPLKISYKGRIRRRRWGDKSSRPLDLVGSIWLKTAGRFVFV